MKQYFQTLKNCALFREIEEQNLTAMLGCLGGKLLTFKKGETVFSEGDPATHLGIVCSGSVQVERVDYDGNRTIVSDVSPGELFAESFACAEVAQLPVSVTVAEDCAVLLLDCRRIIRSCCNACEFHHRMVYNLLQTVALKNIRMHQRTEIISHRTTRDKLMAYLALQAKQQNSRRLTVPFDRQQLADYLEVDRSGLSAEISKLRKEGILNCRKNEFELLK